VAAENIWSAEDGDTTQPISTGVEEKLEKVSMHYHRLSYSDWPAQLSPGHKFTLQLAIIFAPTYRIFRVSTICLCQETAIPENTFKPQRMGTRQGPLPNFSRVLDDRRCLCNPFVCKGCRKFFSPKYTHTFLWNLERRRKTMFSLHSYVAFNGFTKPEIAERASC